MSTAPKKNIEVSTEQEDNTEDNIEENKNNVNREQEDNTEKESE
jgi:hypothetical protein